MTKFKFYVLFALVQFALVANAGVYTFDFTKVDSEGKICGVVFPGADKSVDGQDFTVGDVQIKLTSNGSNDVFINGKVENTYVLKIYETSSINFKSTAEKIVKIEFNFYYNTLADWNCTDGTFTSTSVWEGASNDVTFNKPEPTSMIGVYSITVTTAADYNELSSISDVINANDGDKVRINTDLECSMLSHDGKYALVSEDDNVVYLYAADGFANLSAGQIIKSGLKATKATINNVSCLEVEPGSITSVDRQKVIQTNLASINESMVGKLVEVNLVSIVKNDETLSLSQGGSTLKVENIMLETIEPTANRYRANVVGVIGNDGSQFVINPTSVIVKLYSDIESNVIDNVNVRLESGQILINGDYKLSRVYTIDGILIAENKDSVKCSQGVYLVVVDGVTVAKVIMR